MLREIYIEFEDLFIKFFDFKNCLWEGVGIKFYYEEFKRGKKNVVMCVRMLLK